MVRQAHHERRRHRHRRRQGFGLRAAARAPARVAAMAYDIGFDRRYLDLVAFADQLARVVTRKGAPAILASCRHVVAKRIGIVRQPPVVRLVTELGAAGPRILALLLLVRRRRLGRRARILVGTLKPKHQLDQLLLAELLQISPVHPRMDSEISPRGKGVGNCHEPIASFRIPIEKMSHGRSTSLFQSKQQGSTISS